MFRHLLLIYLFLLYYIFDVFVFVELHVSYIYNSYVTFYIMFFPIIVILN